MTDEVGWDDLKEIFAIGTVASGVVVRHETYGIYVDLGYGYDAIIARTEIKDEGAMLEEEYPSVGSKIKVKVLGYRDHSQQIWLSIKPSKLKGS